MKLTTEDEYSIVSIESKKTGLSADKVVEMFRAIALANEYHPDNIAALMPNEHELDKMVEEALEAQKEDRAYKENRALTSIKKQCEIWKSAKRFYLTKAKMIDIISKIASAELD